LGVEERDGPDSASSRRKRDRRRWVTPDPAPRRVRVSSSCQPIFVSSHPGADVPSSPGSTRTVWPDQDESVFITPGECLSGLRGRLAWSGHEGLCASDRGSRCAHRTARPGDGNQLIPQRHSAMAATDPRPDTTRSACGSPKPTTLVSRTNRGHLRTFPPQHACPG